MHPRRALHLDGLAYSEGSGKIILMLCSSKAVDKTTAQCPGRWGGSSPDPRSGTGVELGGGRGGGGGDLVGVGEGLPGQCGLAEDPPPALLQVQPAGGDRDECVPDPGVVLQPGTGRAA